MKINNLLYHFTGTWTITPSVIEIKDNVFCKKLFGKPDSTISGNGINGFFIANQTGASLEDLIIINQQQFQLKTNNLATVHNILVELERKLVEINTPPFRFSFLSYGLTLDSEIGELNTDNSSTWLSEKFIEANFTLTDEYKSEVIKVMDIWFGVEKDGKQITFQIQPRTNKNDMLFVKISEENNVIIEKDFFEGIDLLFANFRDRVYKQLENLVSNGK